jgi:DNA-binding response OmpR family regulator
MGEAPSDPKDKRVLIVEDDEDVRALFEAAVRREGFKVETSPDGLDALNKVKRQAPDLVVLDLMLPVFGGYEMLKRLQGGEGARIPVIVVSGRYTDPPTVALIRGEANVVEFIEKPVSPSALTESVHRHLGTKSSA